MSITLRGGGPDGAGCECDGCGDDPCEDRGPKPEPFNLGTVHGSTCESFLKDLVSGVNVIGATFNASPLPAGLSVNGSGFIVGTPTEAFNELVTITATNDCGSGTAFMTLIIADDRPCCGLDVELEPNEDNTYDVSGQFPEDTDLSISLDTYTCAYFSGGFHPGFSVVLVYANGALIYNSGCISTGISTTITVPAGTTSLRLVNLYDCTGDCESGGDGSPNAFFECI